MESIQDIVTQWRRVRAKRLELEDIASKLQRGPEAELRAKMLMWLETHGVPGVKTSEGAISRTSKTHLEITNLEAMLRYMYNEMQRCDEQNRPLADAMLFQRTPLKGDITTMVKQRLGVAESADISDAEFNTISETFGIRCVSRADISFTSKK